jgi:hypothetical protein
MQETMLRTLAGDQSAWLDFRDLVVQLAERGLKKIKLEDSLRTLDAEKRELEFQMYGSSSDLRPSADLSGQEDLRIQRGRSRADGHFIEATIGKGMLRLSAAEIGKSRESAKQNDSFCVSSAEKGKSHESATQDDRFCVSAAEMGRFLESALENGNFRKPAVENRRFREPAPANGRFSESAMENMRFNQSGTENRKFLESNMQNGSFRESTTEDERFHERSSKTEQYNERHPESPIKAFCDPPVEEGRCHEERRFNDFATEDVIFPKAAKEDRRLGESGLRDSRRLDFATEDETSSQGAAEKDRVRRDFATEGTRGNESAMENGTFQNSVIEDGRRNSSVAFGRGHEADSHDSAAKRGRLLLSGAQEGGRFSGLAFKDWDRNRSDMLEAASKGQALLRPQSGSEVNLMQSF